MSPNRIYFRKFQGWDGGSPPDCGDWRGRNAGPGLDRPLPRAALDTLDYPVLDAAVFHAQPTSEARVVNFAQMGPPLLAAFRLDV
jgi:hypothetical protein